MIVVLVKVYICLKFVFDGIDAVSFSSAIVTESTTNYLCSNVMLNYFHHGVFVYDPYHNHPFNHPDVPHLNFETRRLP